MSPLDRHPTDEHPPHRHPTDDEPGVPLGRTSLAWHRTGLATTAIGVLLLHSRADDGVTWWPGVGALLAGALMMTTAAPLRYSRGGRSITCGDEPCWPWWVLTAALAVAAVIVAVAVGVVRRGVA